MTPEEMLAEVKKDIEQISVDQAKSELDSGETVFLDVREPGVGKRPHPERRTPAEGSA
jgi:hypothetical protein